MSGDRFGGGSGDAGDCLPTSGELIAGLNRLRDAMAQVQHDIENVIVHGHSRDNMVTATMQGTGQLVDITIDPDQPHHRTTDDLGRVVAEAVNDALLKLGDTTRARITSLLTSPDAA
ncbi:YbaB/EbfC family nucleoid-associated protein [Actinophytocola sp.]|uniref:YbaB/EbfC family nucleoid-associated protein n=1 Tax=Actinophytocola sp. TaxID=1872138 RepID=UPI003D6B05B7